MIGQIETSDGRKAVLDNGGHWRSDSKPLKVFLDTLHSPHKQIDICSRALPWWGRDQVASAAKFYGTSPVFPSDVDASGLEEVRGPVPAAVKTFDPDQPRDDSGKWTSEGGSSTVGSDHATESPKKPVLERTVADFHAPNPLAKTSADKYKQDGKYTAERQELHQAIIAKELAGHKVSINPTMYMLGGGTAAGKSSALASGEFKIPDDVVHIDSDAIKAQLPDYKEMLAAGNKDAAVYVHAESSKISKELIGEAARQKFDGIVDTTGDNGLAYLEDKVAEMRQSGHRVVANYVTVDTETAIARSNKRASETGRVVPEELIRAIHKSVSEVLPQAVSKQLFDEVTLWDTNTGHPVKVMSAGKGQVMTVHDQVLWQKFLDKAK